MRFLPWWRDRRSSDPAGNRLARFRKVIEAARGVSLYSTSLRFAGLDTPKACQRITDIEYTLSQLGVFNLDQVRRRPRRDISSPVIFASPLSEGIRPEVFWNSTGCAVVEGKAGPKRGARALFIRIGFDEGLLSPIERDGLWHRHGVPMFEHLAGMDGQLLAWECEAHRGLHIVEENTVFESIDGELLLTSLTDLLQPTLQMRTGWLAKIDSEPCDCGRAGRRLLGLRESTAYRGGRKGGDLAIAAHS
jgi:hypothetical protein